MRNTRILGEQPLDGETLFTVVRPSKRALVAPALLALLTLWLSLILVKWGGIWTHVAYGVALTGLLALADAIAGFLALKVAVTDQRFIWKVGLCSRCPGYIPLSPGDAMISVDVQQGPLGRFFDYGTIVVHAGVVTLCFAGMKDARNIADALNLAIRAVGIRAAFVDAAASAG